MTEASITEAIAERRHGGARLVSFHASVDAGVSSTAGFPMALCNEVRRPIPPCASFDRINDALQVDWR